jgi:O-antigen/teichoic acid export membrane protein
MAICAEVHEGRRALGTAVSPSLSVAFGGSRRPRAQRHDFANAACVSQDSASDSASGVDRAASRTARKGSSFVRDGLVTVCVTIATTALGLLTGIIVARTLGPDGRGALTAILSAPQVLGWVFAMGCGKSVTYFLSRDHRIGGRLLTTWLVIFLPLCVLSILAGELLLPILLSAQSAETLALARLYMPTIVIVLMSDLILGLILGDQDFRFFNAFGFAQSAGATLAYVVLWQTGHFTVESASLAQAATSLTVILAGTIRVVRHHGLAWPDLDLALRSFWYAFRAHGEIISGTVAQKLAIFVLPAFLAAVDLGHYAIATSVSSLFVTITGTISTILMPTVTRRGAASGRTLVLKSLQATLIAGLTLGGGLFLFADLAIRLVYGGGFSASVLPLRILIPGTMLYGAASIIIGGLYAENRPFLATVPQLAGMIITIAGLLTLLDGGGLIAAAIVSSVAYATVFFTAAASYLWTTKLGWRAIVPDAADLKAYANRFTALFRRFPAKGWKSIPVSEAGDDLTGLAVKAAPASNQVPERL